MRRAVVVLCFVCVAGCGTLLNREKKADAFSFAVIADVQYADKTVTRGNRHYRESLGMLQACVDDLNRADLAFTIQLGDIIDGNKTPGQTLDDLDAVLEVFRKLSMPVYHVVGNHCLSAGAAELKKRLGMTRFYYDFMVPEAPGWRFVVLDGNDAGYGVMGDPQLEWLRATLEQVRDSEEKAIVFSHFGVSKVASRRHRMKVADPLLAVINEAGCVAAYFAGHDHSGGYGLEGNIHHVTIKGMVEASASNAYAVIRVSPGTLTEMGIGDEPSRVMELKAGTDAGAK